MMKRNPGSEKRKYGDKICMIKNPVKFNRATISLI